MTVRASKFKNIAVLLLISLLLGGCAVRVAYYFLDVALLWSLDDYIDFEGDQRGQAKTAIKEFHRWHRYNELPAYATLFEELADALEGQLTVETIGYFSDATFDAWQTIMRGLAPPSAKILSRLNDEQIQGLVDTMAEEEKDDLEDYEEETEAEVREDRYEFMENAVSKLAGKLTDEQRTMIFAWAASLRNMGQMSVDHRSRWRAHFVKILQTRSDVEQLEKDLTVLYSQPYLFWSEDYQQSMDYNKELSLELLTDLANSMTDKQRAKAVKRLRTIAVDFRALSKEK